MTFQLPYIVLASQPADFAIRWQQQFVKPGRDVEVGMWRREDDEYTVTKFGTDPSSRRRRLVRFAHKYGLVINAAGTYDFVLTHTCIWVSTGLPAQECRLYWKSIISALQLNPDWREVVSNDRELVFVNNGLILRAEYILRHSMDAVVGKSLPSDYNSVEVSVASENAHELPQYDEDVWQNYGQKYRRGLPRGNPRIMSDCSVLRDYFPLHVMLGCGPSIEAGIPPLHELHGIYYVGLRKDGRGFVFGDQDRMILDLIDNPEFFYRKVSGPYKSCVMAAPTNFYKLIQNWATRGLVIQPVINNNFDGLLPLLGIAEKFIRRFEMPSYIPNIRYDTRARGLLVIGNHADRRRVVEGARRQGLQIIFVDPEGYRLSTGEFQPYPIEDIQSEDILLRMTATEFASQAQMLS